MDSNPSEILIKQNFQWITNDFETGAKRELLPTILSSLPARHIVAISGARRSGKSYLFRQIIHELLSLEINLENILQVNLEDPWFIHFRNEINILEIIFQEYLTLKNPRGHIYLFLDEIQNIDKWQYWIRNIYDSRKDIKIFITGSNSELLSVELATHLTGRVLSFENFPFSFIEFFSVLKDEFSPIKKLSDPSKLYQSLFNKKEKIIHYLELSFNKGLFPEIVFLNNEKLQKDILSQYFQNVLFSDIVPRFSIRNTKVIEELAYFLSTNFTSLFSNRKLAQIVGSNENTIKEYLSYFEKAYLFFSVDYFEYSSKKQFKRNRKIYCLDNGLQRATSFSFSKDTGKLAENTVFMILRKKFSKIYYWQEPKTQKEIDFVVKDGSKIYAINISYTDNIRERELESFDLFSNFAKSKRNILISRNIFRKQKLNKVEIEIVPMWLFIFMEF